MKNISTEASMIVLSHTFVIKVSIFLLLISYFYNLPVFFYSIKGNNELRLYDFVGLVFFTYYFFNFYLVNKAIVRVIYLKNFYRFLLYGSFMLIISIAIYASSGRFARTLQGILYMYHMWVFFLGTVFVHYYISSYKVFKMFILTFLICVSVSALIVILQNLELIPFLWSQLYYVDYHGFLSGIMGPNKIVLGMSMLISICMIVGLLYVKSIQYPRIFLYIPLSLAIIALVLSGSRTSYVGLAVFLLYFSFTYTSRFIFFSVAAAIFILLVISFTPKIVEKIEYVIETRITNKLSKPEELESLQDANQVYEDLSAGRDKLHVRYIEFIFSRPQIIPFGQGFNNRSGVGNSAHNMYLTLIVELGLVGLFLFLNWLFSFIKINKKPQPGLQLAVNGIVLSMLVTLYFGEHLYVYRPLFGLMGLFMVTLTILLYPLRKTKYATK